MSRITKRQYEELEEASELDDQEFFEKLEEYAGITRVPYTAYSYYDCHGNYVGSSEEFDLDDILSKAYVEVTENEK